MINLASHDNSEINVAKTTAVVKDELRQAGIDPDCLSSKDRGEVPTEIKGKYKGFEFCRAWYYWIVKGLVPLEVAIEMHKNPIAAKDVRVNGHCGCPAPGESGGGAVEYDLDSEKMVVKDEEWEIGLRLCNESWAAYHISNKDAGPRRALFIDCYHIDSQKGLNLFMETMKKFKVNGRLPS